MNKIIQLLTSITLLAVIFTSNAYAHVSVKPSQANVGQFVTFTMGVPPEKSIPTTSVRLVIPDGVESVRPTVKPGWKIEMKKQGEGEDAKVTEIIWSGGSIPADQRDEFTFSAKVPSSESTINWKAYQTYSDGSVVSWDQPPQTEDNDSEDKGPYSTTKIINDLAATNTTTQKTQLASNSSNNISEYIAYTALLISVISLGLSVRKARTES